MNRTVRYALAALLVAGAVALLITDELDELDEDDDEDDAQGVELDDTGKLELVPDELDAPEEANTA